MIRAPLREASPIACSTSATDSSGVAGYRRLARAIRNRFTNGFLRWRSHSEHCARDGAFQCRVDFITAASLTTIDRLPDLRKLVAGCLAEADEPAVNPAALATRTSAFSGTMDSLLSVSQHEPVFQNLASREAHRSAPLAGRPAGGAVRQLPGAAVRQCCVCRGTPHQLRRVAYRRFRHRGIFEGLPLLRPSIVVVWYCRGDARSAISDGNGDRALGPRDFTFVDDACVGPAGGREPRGSHELRTLPCGVDGPGSRSGWHPVAQAVEAALGRRGGKEYRIEDRS